MAFFGSSWNEDQDLERNSEVYDYGYNKGYSHGSLSGYTSGWNDALEAIISELSKYKDKKDISISEVIGIIKSRK